MKTLYNYMLKSKPMASLLFCYFVIVMVGLLQKLFVFSLGKGDMFYYLFNIVKNSLGTNDAGLTKFFSYLMFLGSFYGVFIRALLYVVFIGVYATLIQFLIHIFVQYPARFSSVLTILFTNVALLYVVNVIPVAGVVIFASGVLYLSAKKIGEVNGFSTLKGIILLLAPKLIGLLIIFLMTAGFINLGSLF